MAECVSCHQVKTEVEVPLQLSAEGVCVTLIGVLEGNDCAVRGIYAGRVVVRRCVIVVCDLLAYCVDGSGFLNCKITEEYIVQGLGIESVEGELPAACEYLLKAKVYAEYLRVFEVLVKGIDGGLSAGLSNA